jgi:hypothetical protein
MNYTIEIQGDTYTVRYCPDSRGFGPIIGIGRTLQQAQTIITMHYGQLAHGEN